MKKRILSFLMAAVMLMGIMTTTAFAETADADTWDGTADTSWYNDTDTEFVIDTAEELAGLAALVDGGNTFEGKTVMLGKDIDLYCLDDKGDKISFNPIGYGYNIVFKGTFDGQGKTISNLYQNGWALGYSYSTAGGGLFASVVDATIKGVNIDNAEIVMECIDMGILVGYSYGNCTYENINVTNSLIANYQRYTGGVVGEVNGTQTFKNINVDENTVISSLWGDFDCSLGGIVGGKYGNATLTFENCYVACQINAYNDVTSSYQWCAYRRAGMLIGNSEEYITTDGRTSATASYLTAINCTVVYSDWAKYTYCEFAGKNWPYVRVQEGYSNSAYSNPRYGHPTDANGNKVVDDNHVHNDGEDHFISCTFNQLYGGGQGVYGGSAHEGVTIHYCVKSDLMDYDNETHWYKCTDDGCNYHGFEKAHDMVDNPADPNGLKCKECAYTVAKHVHEKADDWVNTDPEQHYKKCIGIGGDCDVKFDEEKHTFNTFRNDNDRFMTNVCTVCGYTCQSELSDSEKAKDTFYNTIMYLSTRKYFVTINADEGAVVTDKTSKNLVLLSVDGASAYRYLADVKYTIEAADGYEITAVYLDGKPVDNFNGNLTVKQIKKDHVITVVTAAVEAEEDAAIAEDAE